MIETPGPPREPRDRRCDPQQDEHHEDDSGSLMSEGPHRVLCSPSRLPWDAKDAAWREAVLRVLGEEALELETLAEKRRRTQGTQGAPLGLGDFFFDPEDPLHPDRPLDDDEE